MALIDFIDTFESEKFGSYTDVLHYFQNRLQPIIYIHSVESLHTGLNSKRDPSEGCFRINFSKSYLFSHMVHFRNITRPFSSSISSEHESIIIRIIIGKEQMAQRITTGMAFYGIWFISELFAVDLYLTIFESLRFYNESQRIDSVLNQKIWLCTAFLEYLKVFTPTQSNSHQKTILQSASSFGPIARLPLFIWLYISFMSF
ncbi:Hypothetical_protein [Hexamita inflata]|uniref:Hypothetical_protein n=1 Tax=Hexamita inflata TaxID=28002 RepID=A0AA86Q710_9EUKA|nr:Hypothetical protein HINF_LOCUS40093 [Hexamita inflata]